MIWFYKYLLYYINIQEKKWSTHSWSMEKFEVFFADFGVDRSKIPSWQKLIKITFFSLFKWLDKLIGNALYCPQTWYFDSIGERMNHLRLKVISFWYLQFSQKTNKRKISTLLLWYLNFNCFCSFFGRIEDNKKTYRN